MYAPIAEKSEDGIESVYACIKETLKLQNINNKHSVQDPSQKGIHLNIKIDRYSVKIHILIYH